jgi:hypothetical protein
MNYIQVLLEKTLTTRNAQILCRNAEKKNQ